MTIEPLACSASATATVPTTSRFGYYTPGNRADTTSCSSVIGTANNEPDGQPDHDGRDQLRPRLRAFGLYTSWQNFTAHQQPDVYSEDALNKSYDADSRARCASTR